MKAFVALVKFFLGVCILYAFIFGFVVYKDVVLSLHSRSKLKGKIVYSIQGNSIKLIELPSGKKEALYTRPDEVRRMRGYVHSPSFSPDGKEIVFSQSDMPFDNDKLYIMDSQGKDIYLFLDLEDTGAMAPSWSPDGKYIAFITRQSGKQGLYIISLNNRFVDRISEIMPSPVQPAWSPDSKKIAFASEDIKTTYLGNNRYEERDMGGIYVVSISTKKIEKYIDLALQPSWSPNGKMLACEKKDGYYIANLEESANPVPKLIILNKIPFFTEAGSRPVRWSPDRKYIVYGKEIWPGIAGIYAVDVNNPRRQIRIGTDNEAIIGMSWVE